MALLPMNGNLSSVVITISNHKVDEILEMTDEQFNHQIQQWFGNKLGKISLVGKRHSYPLMPLGSIDCFSTVGITLCSAQLDKA